MTLSMSQASVPALKQTLNALSGIMDKAEAHCTARKIDPAVLLATRLTPDMFPLSRQVQVTCDFAKGTVARLTGVAVPTYEDTETTFPELKARIARTLAFIETCKPAQIDGSEARDIHMKAGPNEFHFKGQGYLFGFALPNFYFHATMAYAILRASGVDVGKFDYLGKVPLA